LREKSILIENQIIIKGKNTPNITFYPN